MAEIVQNTPQRVNTSRFGVIDVSPDQVIILPHGMVGFPNQHRFALVQHRADSPFHWLQSLESPDLAFVVANPLIFDLKYQVSLSNSDTRTLAGKGRQRPPDLGGGHHSSWPTGQDDGQPEGPGGGQSGQPPGSPDHPGKPGLFRPSSPA